MSQVTMTWLGHASFLFTTPAGKKILVDPWLASNPSCPEAFHELAPDAILITHGHGDHIGDLMDVVERSEGPIVAIFELTSWLGGRGVDGDRLAGMNKGGTVELDGLGLKVTMTDARHSSADIDDEGNVQYLGEAAGLVLHFEDGPTVYHAGDTCLFGDMELIGALWEPDVAILPIGDRFTMDPRQAAWAAEMVGAAKIVPAHYATFGLLTGTPEQLQGELDERGLDVEMIAPRAGDEVTL